MRCVIQTFALVRISCRVIWVGGSAGQRLLGKYPLTGPVSTGLQSQSTRGPNGLTHFAGHCSNVLERGLDSRTSFCLRFLASGLGTHRRQPCVQKDNSMSQVLQVGKPIVNIKRFVNVGGSFLIHFCLIVLLRFNTLRIDIVFCTC